MDAQETRTVHVAVSSFMKLSWNLGGLLLPPHTSAMPGCGPSIQVEAIILSSSVIILTTLYCFAFIWYAMLPGNEYPRRIHYSLHESSILRLFIYDAINIIVLQYHHDLD